VRQPLPAFRSHLFAVDQLDATHFLEFASGIGREAATEMKEEGGDPKCKQ